MFAGVGFGSVADICWCRFRVGCGCSGWFAIGKKHKNQTYRRGSIAPTHPGSTHSWLASSTKTRATRHADAARHHGQIGEVPDSFAGVGFGSVADVLGGLR